MDREGIQRMSMGNMSDDSVTVLSDGDLDGESTVAREKGVNRWMYDEWMQR